MIDQILGGQEGSRLDTTLDSRDGEGGLDKSRELQLKQKGRDRESQRMHLREHRELLQSQKKRREKNNKKLRHYYNDTTPS